MNQEMCKCDGGLVILNFQSNESICPICNLPKKLTSERTKNMLKFGNELNQKRTQKECKR